MSELVDTTEMYLKAVWELEEDRVPPLRARIVERLHHTVPTVSQTISRMERDGLLHVEEDRTISLTPLGRGYAMRVMRKHRLAEQLLTEMLGLPLGAVHEEACRWEHVMSTDVERRIVSLLGAPHVDPFGNPVPGLSELDIEASHGELGIPVGACAEGEAQVLRLGEPLQADADVLATLLDAGIIPGALITVGHDLISVHETGKTVPLTAYIAQHLAVFQGLRRD
ncbi:MAG: dihydrofolate reductase [Ruaniaceae bacterium]|nr:dihydrofolate reductase [Ruaniaceae bacterium]